MPDQQVGSKGSVQFQPVGTSGLEAFYGQIHKADQADLHWPGVYPLFNRIYRRDPQVAQWRSLVIPLASSVNFRWDFKHDNPSPADRRVLDFLNTVDDDYNLSAFVSALSTYTPMFGFALWEPVPGIRRRDWRAPDGEDWRSDYNDGYVTIREFAWRDHSSMFAWDMDEKTGKILGWVQEDYPNPRITIPIQNLMHITFGDPTSPEGLSPLEALWRLERFLYNLELVMGIGYEHSAGHIRFKSSQDLSAEDKANIREAARAVMSAVEGNYMQLPAHIDAELIDVPFSAGGSLLDAIRHWGLVKMQVLNIQWMALSTTSNTGSYAAMETSYGAWLTGFNAMMQGFAEQQGRQMYYWLSRWNPALFSGITARPVRRAIPVEETIPLDKLAAFISAAWPLVDADEQDVIALRQQTGFLPDREVSAKAVKSGTDRQDDPESEPVNGPEDGESEPVDSPENAETPEIPREDGEFAEPVAIGRGQPTRSDAGDLADLDDPEELDRLQRSLERWAAENGLIIDQLFAPEN